MTAIRSFSPVNPIGFALNLGHMKLRHWVEADGHDDMDLFIQIRKLDPAGNWLPIHVLGQKHPGSWGRMRVSRRELDEKLSTDYQPVQAHRKDEELKSGEVVPVDIEIWPTSWFWHKGQQLRVIVSGHCMNEGWWLPVVYVVNNKGNHIIHTGGKYDSYADTHNTARVQGGGLRVPIDAVIGCLGTDKTTWCWSPCYSLHASILQSKGNRFASMNAYFRVKVLLKVLL